MNSYPVSPHLYRTQTARVPAANKPEMSPTAMINFLSVERAIKLK